MEIFLLSDTKNLNPKLKDELAEKVLENGGRVAYISSAPQDKNRFWFHNTKSEYQTFNPKISLEYFDLSDQFSDEDLKRVLNYGTIHLSGGNTYEFLNWIRKRHFKSLLKAHVEKNGLIIGVSAGSIILTPTITIASSENTIGLKDATGLNFVDFEFNPHFQNTAEELEKLTRYSLQTPNIIYSCSDKNGIFFDGHNPRIIGNAFTIKQGKIF